MTPDQAPPRAALDVFTRRLNVAVVVGVVALCFLAWRSTIDQANSMRGMVMGLGQIGIRNQGEMSATVFLAMWVTMMVAMMLPTVAPRVFAHLAVARRRGEGAMATLAFIGGYLLVWSAIGVVPLLVYQWFAQLGDEAAQSRWLPTVAGLVLIVAGAYQFTGWKRVCFDHCQSPFAFVVAHDFAGGARSALAAGIAHGAYCVGCCGALTAVLLVVGLMNLAWMAGLFVLMFVEKNWKHGIVLARIAGLALIMLGTAVVVRPAILEAIAR